MRKNKSIPLYKIESYFFTVRQNALHYNLSTENSAEYFIEEMRTYFKMPNLKFDFQSLCLIEVFLKKRFNKLNAWAEDIVQVYGIIYGHTIVENLGGIWMPDVDDDEPTVCFEFNKIASVNPISQVRKFFLENERPPTALYYGIVFNGMRHGFFDFDIKALIPNYKLFAKLSESLQWAVVVSICEECEVAERNTPTHKIWLLQVNDFYIEHRINKKTCAEGYNAFDASSKRLQPYLTPLTIPTF